MILYGIANCDSVKRARAWLAERGAGYEFHDFRRASVPGERLDAWIAAVGWQRLVNRQGSTWRKLDPAEQQAVVDDASARTLMLAHGSVVKRPVVEWDDGAITVGFDAAGWALRARRA
jgi:arsenate reductase (glutaredoxin)